MKLTFVAVLLVVLIVGEVQSIRVAETDYWMYETGDWTKNASAQPEIGDNPSMYYICGYGMQELKWEKNMQNCNCGYVVEDWWVVYKCDWCINTFWTKTKAFKAIYCDYSDWSKQTENQFDTGAPDGRDWKIQMCPKGQYASKLAPKYGY